MDWESRLEKYSIQKIEKKQYKYEAKLPHVKTKPLANFCSNTVFSLCFKIRGKNFLTQNHSLFCSTSSFIVTKIATSIWLQKSWNCWTDPKKRQRPNTIQILCIVKRQSTNKIQFLDCKINNTPKKSNFLTCKKKHIRTSHHLPFK